MPRHKSPTREELYGYARAMDGRLALSNYTNRWAADHHGTTSHPQGSASTDRCSTFSDCYTIFTDLSAIDCEEGDIPVVLDQRDSASQSSQPSRSWPIAPQSSNPTPSKPVGSASSQTTPSQPTPLGFVYRRPSQSRTAPSYNDKLTATSLEAYKQAGSLAVSSKRDPKPKQEKDIHKSPGKGLVKILTPSHETHKTISKDSIRVLRTPEDARQNPQEQIRATPPPFDTLGTIRNDAIRVLPRQDAAPKTTHKDVIKTLTPSSKIHLPIRKGSLRVLSKPHDTRTTAHNESLRPVLQPYETFTQEEDELARERQERLLRLHLPPKPPLCPTPVIPSEPSPIPEHSPSHRGRRQERPLPPWPNDIRGYIEIEPLRPTPRVTVVSPHDPCRLAMDAAAAQSRANRPPSRTRKLWSEVTKRSPSLNRATGTSRKKKLGPPTGPFVNGKWLGASPGGGVYF
ncbi:hypothetical protein ANO11243_018750 [Dothideomycetidae sp. 11243]|nr:hypothetical protein ANO11243_018750 [fungal sp. No.11243]